MNTGSERWDYVPPFNRLTAVSSTRRPVRLQRPRKRTLLPPNATYVGKPTLWGNPFERRAKIGHARSVILFDAWLKGDVSPYVLARAGFSADEVVALRRRRAALLDRLGTLAGRDLQCWCPATSAWCHAEILIKAANT